MRSNLAVVCWGLTSFNLGQLAANALSCQITKAKGVGSPGAGLEMFFVTRDA